MISFAEEANPNEEKTPMARPFISFVIPEPTTADSSRFNVQLDDGRVYTVDMPEGCSVGDKVHAVVMNNFDTGESSLFLIPPEESISKTDSTTIPMASADHVEFEEMGGEEESTKFKKPKMSKAAMAAIAAGGVIGTIVAGPIVGAVVAGVVLTGATVPKTAAYQHAKDDFKQSTIGMKTTAATAAASAKLKAIDGKLGVSDTMKKTGDSIAIKVNEVDSKYEISEKTAALKTSVGEKVSTASATVSRQMKEADEKYHVSEKVKSTAKSVGDDLKIAGSAFASKANQLYRQASLKFNNKAEGEGCAVQCSMGDMRDDTVEQQDDNNVIRL